MCLKIINAQKKLNKQKKSPPELPVKLSGKDQQVYIDPTALTTE